MALPQARPPWLDTTMPRTPTATACGAAQGRTKMDGKRREKKVVMVCFHLQIFTFFILFTFFHLHLFPSKVCFLLVLHLHLDKKNEKKNTHHNTCLATAGFWRSWEGASLGDITTWLLGLFTASSTWLLEKMDDSHFYHILLINKNRNIFHLKTNLKKLPPCSQCPPRWCFVQSSPAVHPQHFECLSDRQVHLPQWLSTDSVRASFDVISPRMSFFGEAKAMKSDILPSNNFSETIL